MNLHNYLSQKNYRFDGVNDKSLQTLWRELEKYGGLVQDFSLLPQIIGNTLWGVQGKPLKKLYYIGYAMIRLVIQAFDYARDPVPHSSSKNEFQYLRVEPYYKLGNLIISGVVVTLAVNVHIQQRNGYMKGMPTRKPKPK
ncbi:hypothetical protein ACH5RR_004256 [Cinchona calisaya]|uniref:RING-type E3 ubiquitin transferase n=1 Tax=Cinchona calisaya TaxID=153742 RepID=A0ABD3AX13_9GENT